MRALALSAIIVGGLLSSHVAEADCSVPSWVGMKDGAPVPRKGILFMHDEALAWDSPAEPISWVKLAWERGEGTVRVVRVEGAPTLAMIEYEGPANALLRIYDRWDEATELWLYDEWRQPQRAPRVLQYWHHQNEWTCSSADSLIIQIDQPTAAVRVHWTVNGHSVDYWEATRNDGTKSVLELGKIDCGGENVPLEQLYDGVGIELYAVRPDGSEVKIEGMPARVSLAAMQTSEGHLDQALTIVATQEPAAAQARLAPTPEDAGRGLGIVVMILAGLGVIVSVWLLRRAERSASDCSPAS